MSCSYTIVKRNFEGKPHVCIAEQRYGGKKYVVLKFYWDETAFQNTLDVHSKFDRSEHAVR